MKFNKSDGYLLLVYYLFAVSVGFMMDSSGSRSIYEAIINNITYVIFSLALFCTIVFIVIPRLIPDNRIIAILISIIMLFIISGILEYYCYKLYDNYLGTSFNYRKLPTVTLILYSLITSFQNVGVLLGLFLAKKYYTSQQELKLAEANKRDNELRILKAQIDPHFLYNNLNSLDALIQFNPDLAREYVQRLSKLYRYLLKTKDDELVLLNDEIEFAKNYIFLIENRFGDAYKFSFIGVPNNDRLIPPGTLQTVLENVQKHNIGTSDRPINTIIEILDKKIIVSNNIVPNEEINEIGGLGLANLKTRYKLLNSKEIEIKTDDKFSIILPLINLVD